MLAAVARDTAAEGRPAAAAWQTAADALAAGAAANSIASAKEAYRAGPAQVAWSQCVFKLVLWNQCSDQNMYRAVVCPCWPRPCIQPHYT